MAGIINLFVDDLFGTGGNEMEQRVLTRLRKYFQVVSEDWNDVAFTRQRIRWTQDPQIGPYIEVSQEKAIEDLEEIPVKRNTKEDLQCTPAVHTMHRSLQGQIIGCGVGHSSNVATSPLGALQWQRLQQLAM